MIRSPHTLASLGLGSIYTSTGCGKIPSTTTGQPLLSLGRPAGSPHTFVHQHARESPSGDVRTCIPFKYVVCLGCDLSCHCNLVCSLSQSGVCCIGSKYSPTNHLLSQDDWPRAPLLPTVRATCLPIPVDIYINAIKSYAPPYSSISAVLAVPNALSSSRRAITSSCLGSAASRKFNPSVALPPQARSRARKAK